MNCKEFEQMIPLYFHNELNEKELAIFAEHLESCASCKEELTIQYLITEGMQRLEDGSTLDVDKELSEKLVITRYYLRRKRHLHIIHTILKVAGVLILLSVLLDVV